MLVSNSNKYSDSNIGFKNENILNAIMSEKYSFNFEYCFSDFIRISFVR